MPTPLHRLREQAGYEPFEVARHLKVTPSAYYKWEAGRSHPNGKHHRALARFLKVAPQDIQFGKEPA